MRHSDIQHQHIALTSSIGAEKCDYHHVVTIVEDWLDSVLTAEINQKRMSFKDILDKSMECVVNGFAYFP